MLYFFIAKFKIYWTHVSYKGKQYAYVDILIKLFSNAKLKMKTKNYTENLSLRF